ncbi:MAG: HD domain-containing protein [Candidatus Omnitrophica bacterium]|nr:HD domain-containing protein [Candidatus Omnitrophota bacterium]
MEDAKKTENMGQLAAGGLLSQAFCIAKGFSFEEQHATQVATIALQIFDELKKLHMLDEYDKLLLHIACLLHDIGWIEGQIKHHKISCKLIISSGLKLPLRQKIITGLIARYHRKSLPKASQKLFAKLDKKEQLKVCWLSAFLRLADGLDRTHNAPVKSIKCKVTKFYIIVYVNASVDSRDDLLVGREKADLLKLVSKKRARLIWRAIPEVGN